uniref:Serpentine receptor class gamma n=1 Tax=Panagrellus redivivus TaxID=6233 RepID=A0A7E4VZ62_PANRE
MPLTPLFASYFEIEEPTYLWSVPYFFAYYLEFVHIMLVMVTALNRFTALCLPVKHGKIWKRLMMPVLVLSFVFPLTPCFHRLLVPTYTIPFYINCTNAFVMQSVDIDWYPNGMNALFFAIFYIVIGVITILLNVSSCLSLTFIKQKNQSNFQQQKSVWQTIQRTEVGLILVCFGDLVAMICMIIIQMTLFYLGVRGLYYDPLYDFMYLQIPWVSDLGRFIRPFMLLFMSKSVRDAFLSAFPIRPNPDTTITIATTIIRSIDTSSKAVSKVSIGPSPIYHHR